MEEDNDLEVINSILEMEDLCKKTLEKICQLINNFKDSGSVEEGEMEKLGTAKESIKNRLNCLPEPQMKMLREFVLNGDAQNVRLWLKNHGDQLERCKVELDETKDLNLNFDEYQKRFPKLNVPKYDSEPLEQYLGRLRDFMQITWKEPAKKNREKEQRSLIDWM